MPTPGLGPDERNTQYADWLQRARIELMGTNLLCNMSNSYAQLYIGAIPLDNTALIESEPTPLHQLVSSDPRFVFVYSSVGW